MPQHNKPFVMNVALTFTLLKINAWTFLVVFLYSWYQAGQSTIETTVTVAAQACVLIRVFSGFQSVQSWMYNPGLLYIIQFVCVTFVVITDANIFIVWGSLGCVFPLCVGLLEAKGTQFPQIFVGTSQPNIICCGLLIAWMSVHHTLTILISQSWNGSVLAALALGFLVHQTCLCIYLTRVRVSQTRDQSKQSQPVQPDMRTPRHWTFLYVTTAPVLFAAFLYYDFIILFILLYTNHVQIPKHIQDYHGLTWFQEDSLRTMATIACMYVCTLETSSVVFRHIACQQRFAKHAFHICTALRVVSMWALVDPELSIYAGSVSAILSGSYNLRMSLPNYTDRINRLVEITTSVILVILCVCSIHLDSQIATVLVPLVVASACTICVVFQVIVVYANCKPDMTVVDLMAQKCTSIKTTY